MALRTRDFFALAEQLPGVERREGPRYTTVKVQGQTWAYCWEPTQTVGLKQLVSEQLALVAERPEVFEVQFTVGAFGWVVVRLAEIELQELAELTYEAWRLTAAAELREAYGERLPS